MTMKGVMVLLFSILCLNAFSFDITAGSMVNYHYQNDFKKLNNKLTDNGRYVISPYYLSVGAMGVSAFTTRDCLNKAIFGILYTKSLITVWRLNSSLAIGAYSLDQDAWSKVSKQYWFDGGIVPLVGIVNTIDLYKKNKFTLEFKNSIFPTIIQNGLFLKFEF